MSAEVLQYLPYLGAAYLAFAMGILSPGPNILAIVGTSMGTSRRAGLMMAFGISTGSLVWASLAVLGLTAILASFAWFGTVLRVVGGCYLIWLASKYLRSAYHGGEIKVSERKVTKSDGKLFLQGLGVQMTNPKAAMYWLSILSLILRPEAPFWVAAVMIIGTGVISFTAHSAWAVLFSTNGVISFYQSFKRIIDGVFGTFFTGLGLGLILSAFKNGSKT